MHQHGPEGAVPVPLPGRLLGRQLRTGPGGTDAQAEHGRSRGDSRLSPDHSKYGRLLVNPEEKEEEEITWSLSPQ